MKLVTFQSIDALKDLFEKGYLKCNKTKIDLEKVGTTYEWVVEKMKNTITNNCDEIFSQIDKIVSYKDINTLDIDRKERLEFLLIWYIIFVTLSEHGRILIKHILLNQLIMLRIIFGIGIKINI